MSDLEALAQILTNPGVQAFAFTALGCVMLTLSCKKLARNAARIGRGWRRGK